jgi:hypothetical protein
MFLKDPPITNIIDDLADGTVLANLLEILTGDCS